jgi:TolA-binding protein
MLAEIYYVDLKDTRKALDAYNRVHETFPESKWAAKALYARFWITRNVLKNDSLASALAEQLRTSYPRTEYAVNAAKMISPEPDSTNADSPDSLSGGD